LNFDGLKAQGKDEWSSVMSPAVPQIFVGMATCGQAAGANKVFDAIEKKLFDLQIDAELHRTGCLGECYREPLVDIIKPGQPRITYHSMTPQKAGDLVEDYLVNDRPRPDLALGIWANSREGMLAMDETAMLQPQKRLALRNAGLIDPENIMHYIGRGGYSGLDKALQVHPEDVIAEIQKAGLRGRGGAGFPTFLKWKLCREAKGNTKYVICNADEGDPGAFMNRALLESDPHSMLEGLLIAAYAVGAKQGFIYVREEYPLAIKRLEAALEQMTAKGLLGENILDSGFSFNIRLSQGAGAFVCGEETALMTSLEGHRGAPRPRPPFPVESGLWSMPTSINNVETLAHVASIMARGAEEFRKYGTEKSKGTKTLSLAGNVKRTGLIEVTLGTSLREIIYGIGGGIAGDKRIKAVQTGGPSGGCLPAALLDLGVDYETLANAGSIMGSGGMVVMDEHNCMVDIARYFLSFTELESCGKCIPCRAGTRQLRIILDDIVKGHGKTEDLETLERLGKSVKSGALCGLGQTAPNPLLTTLKYFHEEYEAHLAGRCPGLVCPDLFHFEISVDKCLGCGICRRACPSQAIKGSAGETHYINQGRCTRCGMCFDVCPRKFGAVTRVSGKASEYSV
jgi:NADH-quinone oxidoreductase subunit F